MTILGGKGHAYAVAVTWTGNAGSGTADGRGDPALYNPVDLLAVSLGVCHMPAVLDLRSAGGVVVETCEDVARGRVVEQADGGGASAAAVLPPEVTLAPGASFIASSVNVPLRHEPVIRARAVPG